MTGKNKEIRGVDRYPRVGLPFDSSFFSHMGASVTAELGAIVGRLARWAGSLGALACATMLMVGPAEALPPINKNCGNAGSGGSPAANGLQPPDVFNPVDEFGVSLTSGAFSASMPGITIGDSKAGGLSFVRTYDSSALASFYWRDNFVGTLNSEYVFCGNPPYDTIWTVTVDGQ